MRIINNAERTADELLTIVDFLNGVDGTVDHGNGQVPIPNALPRTLLEDLLPILEQQYGATIETGNNELLISGTTAVETIDTDPSADLSGRENNSDSTTRKHVTPASVIDEVLFVIRELSTDRDQNMVEYQTEQLPDSVGRPEVLAELVAFCNRQSDIVESVTIQDDAPPGFLEIEFEDRVHSKNGLETLYDRYVAQYGGTT